MFGYITVDPGSLQEEEKKRYQSWYCGLCQKMSQIMGETGRMALSNDMTFLYILISSVYDQTGTDTSRACPMHPLKKRRMHITDAASYCADMNLLLAYYKLLDDIRDEHHRSSRLRARNMEKEIGQIQARYPEKNRRIQQALESIHELEDAQSNDIDALCRLSGDMVAEVFDSRNDIFSPLFRRIGYALGQFIYLMDAWEDYDEDLKKHRFNPLRSIHDAPGYEDTVWDALSGMLGEAVAAADLLPIEQDRDLIEHVLLRGVFYRYHLRMQKKEKHQEQTESAQAERLQKGADSH